MRFRFLKIAVWLMGLTASLHADVSRFKPYQKVNRFVIVVPSYNNLKWLSKNIDSITTQVGANYRIIYLNDASTDGTGEAVEEHLRSLNRDFRVVHFECRLCEDSLAIARKFAEEVNSHHKFFILVNNESRCGSLENIYRAVHSCDDNEIIVLVDGDDWLSRTNVLAQLNGIYLRNNVWLTHGTLLHYPGYYGGWCEPIPQEVINRNEFRSFKCATHLRTFYAWLFKKIRLDDLTYEGKFFPMTGDMAFMFPMIEMAAERHYFIVEPNYIYNIASELNDNKVDAPLQRFFDHYIRSLPPYNRL